MSDPDEETKRECRVCREFLPWSAVYCSHCGAVQGRESGAMPLLARIVTDALVQLADVGLDDAGLDLQHQLRELATVLGAWKRRPPEESERSEVTDRALGLALAAGEYSAGRGR